MSLIRPFRGLRPSPRYTVDVIAPPYDVLNSDEARERARDKPWSFLHVSKAEIDLPAGTDPYDPAVYAKAAANLNKMIDAGILVRDTKPCYYAYRLVMGDHSQLGLAAVASVADYDTNRIRKHEFTHPLKEDDRVNQIEAVNAQTGPVLLAYPTAPQVDEVLAEATLGKPASTATASDGVEHTLWIVSDEDRVRRLTGAFDKLQALYIADGHHRSAAAARVCTERKRSNKNHTGKESYNYFLSVIFPHHQMKILDYNRVVRDLGGVTKDDLLVRIAENFEVTTSAAPVKPQTPAEFGMYLEGQWYRLNLHRQLIPAGDPVARLDVSLLATWLVEPILDIHDPRRDERIDYVGGIRGLAELEKRVDSGEMALAFALYPTRMEDLMAVADVAEVMPPKSTWFEPKLADGLVSHVLD
jgi:uncharacterized protein (DUF1015 family)